MLEELGVLPEDLQGTICNKVVDSEKETEADQFYLFSFNL